MQTGLPTKLAGQIEFPAKALPLFRPAPFKVMWGGRGGSKTWDFCRALLILGSQRRLFILCAREIQKSISESVHRVLALQIEEMGLSDLYRVMSHRIVGENGTEFVFAGIRNNITAIKSMEGIDICAVFEATFVSAHSWDILLPTIRGDAPKGPFGKGSEVWVEFNPELASDETYKRWVLSPPDGAIVININWSDNKWFPEYLRKQKDDLKKRDYDSYLTVWEGHTRRVLQGAIYAKELDKAQADHRISTNITLDRSKPVDVGVDLGRADTTALWFAQQIGMQHQFIGYYSNFGFDWGHYLEEMQNRRYLIGTIYLPHDAGNKVIQAKKSILAQTRDAYPGERRVRLVPRTPSVVNDINIVRTMFSRFFFSEKECADGLTALAHYKYEVDPETKEVSAQPDHNWACMTAETKVLTRNGTKCIKDLPEQGEVLTPCGWKPYHNPRVTRRNAPLVAITFADGLTVNCTADHLFLTGNGWRYAGSLRPGSQILSSLTFSRSISMASSIGFGLATRTLRAEAATYISTCGRRFLASAVRAFTSIIETICRPITGLKISNVCQTMSISNSQPPGGSLTARNQLSGQKPGMPPPLGTDHQPGFFGTSGTLSAVRVGQNGSAGQRSAGIAAPHSRHLFAGMGINRFGAPTVASVAPTIAAVRSLDRTEDVWCLSVPEGNWWSLENGAVVHNSHGADALRTYCMGLKEHGEAGRRAQQHQPPPIQDHPRGVGWMAQ